MNTAAQCIIKCDNEYYIVYNHRHKKYAPIGGKGENGETSVQVLFREISEEIGKVDISNIFYIGVHEHVRSDGSKTGVHIYVVTIRDKKVKALESFLEILPLNQVRHLMNADNSYSSLLAIIKALDE